MILEFSPNEQHKYEHLCENERKHLAQYTSKLILNVMTMSAYFRDRWNMCMAYLTNYPEFNYCGICLYHTETIAYRLHPSSLLLLLLWLIDVPLPKLLYLILGECVCTIAACSPGENSKFGFGPQSAMHRRTQRRHKQSIFKLNVGQSLIYSACLFATIFRNRLSQYPFNTHTHTHMQTKKTNQMSIA